MKEKIRVGLCGLGSFSFLVANTVQRIQKVELVTCYDPVAEKRDAASRRYNIAQERVTAGVAASTALSLLSISLVMAAMALWSPVVSPTLLR